MADQQQDSLDHSHTLMGCLYTLQGQHVYTDVEIVCGGRCFPAHRNVLHAGSDYFRAMFESGMKEATTCRVELNKGLDADSFALALKFIYTGLIDDEGDLKNNDKRAVESLLAAAHFLQVERLSQHCWAALSGGVSETCFADVWNTAVAYSNHDLVETIETFVAASFPLTSRADDFRRLSEAQVTRLLRHPALRSSPDSSLEAVFTWIYLLHQGDNCDDQQQQQHRQDDDRLRFLPNLLPCVDLAAVSTACWTSVLTDVLPCFPGGDVFRPFLEATAGKLTQCDTSLSPPTPSGQRLCCFGNSNDNRGAEQLSCVVTYNHRDHAWSHVTTLPFALKSGAALVECGGHVYVIGGSHSFAGASSTAFKFFPETSSVSAVASTLTPVRQAGAEELGGKIYLIGGVVVPAGGRAGVVQCYDPSRDEWCYRADTLSPHSCPVTVNVNDQLYVVGSVSCLNVEMYDPDADFWTLVTVIPGPLSFGSPLAVAYSDKIYIKTEQMEQRDWFLVFDPRSNEWEEDVHEDTLPEDMGAMWSASKSDQQLAYILAINAAGRRLYSYRNKAWGEEDSLPHIGDSSTWMAFVLL